MCIIIRNSVSVLTRKFGRSHEWKTPHVRGIFTRKVTNNGTFERELRELKGTAV